MMPRLAAAALGLSIFAFVSCKGKDLTAIRPGTLFVAVRDSFFSPDTVRVTVGTPVRWTNEGAVYHSVVSDSALWTSNLLAPTWWFEVRFDSAGTFPYHCSQHARMIGTVIVAP